jgi:hypothetical protein
MSELDEDELDLKIDALDLNDEEFFDLFVQLRQIEKGLGEGTQEAVAAQLELVEEMAKEKAFAAEVAALRAYQRDHQRWESGLFGSEAAKELRKSADRMRAARGSAQNKARADERHAVIIEQAERDWRSKKGRNARATAAKIEEKVRAVFSERKLGKVSKNTIYKILLKHLDCKAV